MFDKDKFMGLFSSLDKKTSSVAILVQRNPDPDCIGSAVGFGLLLKEVFGLKSTIFYTGKISHPQNKAMKNLLHIQMKEGSEFTEEDHSRFVVLDTDLSGTGFKSATLARATVRIDHHSMDRDPEAEYEDVRQVGSTCTIVSEYLESFSVGLSSQEDVATALLLGIKTDTLEFTSTNTTEGDMNAYRTILPYINRESLARISNFSIPNAIFEIEAIGFRDRVIDGNILVTFVGHVEETNRDAIPMIADKMIRMDGIETVVIMGCVGSDLVASVRSIDDRIEVATLCEKTFGKEHSGAKDGSGGARVPLLVGPTFSMIEDEALKESLTLEIVKHYTGKILKSAR